MTWEEYCQKKKIDSGLFKQSEPERWKEWKTLFEQVHPNSFTEQKKFLINDIRRKYLLKEEVKVVEEKKENTTPTSESTSTEVPPVKKTGGVKIPPRKTN